MSRRIVLFMWKVLTGDYVGHVYARSDRVVGILLSDKDYPKRVAHTLLGKILDDFALRYPVTKLGSTTTFVFPELDAVPTSFDHC
jgi:synaptobrevin homolog YKT6